MLSTWSLDWKIHTQINRHTIYDVIPPGVG